MPRRSEELNLAELLTADDFVAVLTRNVPVRLVNISASGCLVESATRVEPGTSAALQLEIGGEKYSDDLRVARVQQVQGASGTWQIGAEFLWTSHPGSWSLRRKVSRLRQQIAQQAVQSELAASRLM
jgi:hypothetical protein